MYMSSVSSFNIHQYKINYDRVAAIFNRFISVCCQLPPSQRCPHSGVAPTPALPPLRRCHQTRRLEEGEIGKERKMEKELLSIKQIFGIFIIGGGNKKWIQNRFIKPPPPYVPGHCSLTRSRTVKETIPGHGEG